MGRMAAHTGQVITFDDMLNCEHEMAPGVDKLTWIRPRPSNPAPTASIPSPHLASKNTASIPPDEAQPHYVFEGCSGRASRLPLGRLTLSFLGRDARSSQAGGPRHYYGLDRRAWVKGASLEMERESALVPLPMVGRQLHQRLEIAARGRHHELMAISV